MHDRRSFLKAIGVCGTTVSVAASGGVARTAESASPPSERSVKLVLLNLVHDVTPEDDRLRLAESHVDRFTQYAVQDGTLVVSSERAEDRLSFDGYVASPQNLGAETFKSLARPISLAGGSDYIVTEIADGLSPTKAVRLRSTWNGPTASIEHADQNVLNVEFRGLTATVRPMETATIESADHTMQVEVTNDNGGNRRFAAASVVPILHVENIGELKYHSKV